MMKTLTTAMLLLSGCISPVVGGECRDGLVVCDGRCVDLSYDSQNCGACGLACENGTACVSGLCEAAPADGAIAEHDAGAPSIEVDAGAWPTVRSGVRAPRVGPSEMGEPCALGELACSDGCVRADRDPANCGACGRACGDDEICVDGSCAVTCSAPFTMCGATCVDIRRDPDHCGGCGIGCNTGVCIEGACQSSLAGHLVVIGHDYTVRREGMARIVGNAALIARGRTIDVLAFDGTATAESRAGAIAAIDATAVDAGRTIVHESTPADLVSYELASADVFLIHAQRDLPLEAAQVLGHAWEPAVHAFLERGGTIVALVAPNQAGGTLAILEAARLLEPATTVTTEITGAYVTVARSSDAVAVGVPLRYRAERATVRLPYDADEGVVVDDVGTVVLHRTIVPSP